MKRLLSKPTANELLEINAKLELLNSIGHFPDVVAADLALAEQEQNNAGNRYNRDDSRTNR